MSKENTILVGHADLHGDQMIITISYTKRGLFHIFITRNTEIVEQRIYDEKKITTIIKDFLDYQMVYFGSIRQSVTKEMLDDLKI